MSAELIVFIILGVTPFLIYVLLSLWVRNAPFSLFYKETEEDKENPFLHM